MMTNDKLKIMYALSFFLSFFLILQQENKYSFLKYDNKIEIKKQNKKKKNLIIIMIVSFVVVL